MKTLLSLLLFTSVSASAETLPSLKVDLDRDGRADLVRILPLDKNFNRLQVKLSASRQTITLDHLVRTTVDQKEGLPEEERGTYCGNVTEISLAAGRNGSFVWTEKLGDFDACAGEIVSEFHIRLERDTLVVSQQKIASNSYSMGDPSPYLFLDLNYTTGRVSGAMGDHHGEEGKVVEASARFSCDPVALKQFEKMNHPACAEAALKIVSRKISADCGRYEDSHACPVKYGE